MAVSPRMRGHSSQDVPIRATWRYLMFRSICALFIFAALLTLSVGCESESDHHENFANPPVSTAN